MPERVSLYLPDHYTTQQALAAIKYAEARGFDVVWQAESGFVRDPLVMMAYFASQTQRIRLGCGVVNHYARHVAALCAALVTLYDIAPKRVLCALGPWSDELALSIGMERRKPLLAMREAVAAMKQVLALETVTLVGETLSLASFRLELPLVRPEPFQIPIYIGAVGAFVPLAGEIADGILLNSMVSPAYTAYAVEEARLGMRKGRRDPASVEIGQLIACIVQRETDPPGTATTAAKRRVAAAIMRQPTTMRAMGVPQGLIDEIVQIGRIHPHDEALDAAAQEIPVEVARLVIACGTEAEVRAGVRQYVEAGVTQPVIIPLDVDARPVIDAFAQGYNEPAGRMWGQT
jgi:5,10-methylenetetrahydromethanopterin reductase